MGIAYTPLDELLSEADFVSVHVPLTEETYHIIDKNQLTKMKKTAHLINTSRGPVVDEKALYEVLKNRTIAGADIDVFEQEPLDPNSSLIELDNIVMTPHTASIDTRTAMAVMAATNLISALEGKEPPNAVNPEAKKNLEKMSNFYQTSNSMSNNFET